jgi:sec-independent protein translocase protein TatA
MGPLGWQETVFIFLLALLIFGPKKLPELGKTLGKAMTEFRRASNELKSTFDREMSNLERETQLKEISSAINYDTYNYDNASYDPATYGHDDDTHPESSTSTSSASAPQGAQSTAAALPEGTVANGTVAQHEKNPEVPAGSPAAPEHPADTKAV